VAYNTGLIRIKDLRLGMLHSFRAFWATEVDCPLIRICHGVRGIKLCNGCQITGSGF
jgi:hypothetical protein